MEQLQAENEDADGQSRLTDGLGILCMHKGLGSVWITESCTAMQAMNPDSTSMFVEHEGEIKEVTKRMVTIPNV